MNRVPRTCHELGVCHGRKGLGCTCQHGTAATSSAGAGSGANSAEKSLSSSIMFFNVLHSVRPCHLVRRQQFVGHSEAISRESLALIKAPASDSPETRELPWITAPVARP